jgi:hypothetical protein
MIDLFTHPQKRRADLGREETAERTQWRLVAPTFNGQLSSQGLLTSF